MNILRFDSPLHWRDGVATFWRDRLRVQPNLRQCLASGNTPIPVFQEMVRAVELRQVSFSQSEVFALDEFGDLAANDPGTCRNMLLRDLIGHADLPQSHFHFFNSQATDLAKECATYDEAARPGFDLVLLGLGANGHLGMNEPGSDESSPTRRTELHPSTIAGSAKYLTHQRLPEWGLTVGMQQFFAAREVWLLATSSAKAAIVAQVVQGEITKDVPASLLRRHPNCSLFLDAEAAALLGNTAAK